MRLGIPRIMTSDNGKEFKNRLDDDLASQLGVKRIFTTPYHPQVCISQSCTLAGGQESTASVLVLYDLCPSL